MVGHCRPLAHKSASLLADDVPFYDSGQTVRPLMSRSQASIARAENQKARWPVRFLLGKIGVADVDRT